MKISGLQKLSILDFPEKTSCIVFCGNCNFRCPFCQNGSLVFASGDSPEITTEEFFEFLNKRRGLLDGVCITGGEPTLQPGLCEFIKEVKDKGFAVKLDTNGYRPEILEKLLNENLLDYVAMDIKNCEEKYPATCGLKSMDFSKIKKSISLLMNGKIPFEFRTTVAKELHTLRDIEKIAKLIEGAPAYYLQNYRESEDVICPGFTPFSSRELLDFKTILTPFFPKVEIRGM